jgi:hypothetical protein
LQFESCCCCMLAVVISQDWWRSLSKYHRYTTAIFFDLYSTFLQGKTKRIISNSPCFDSDPNYQSNCLTFESNLGNKNESEGTWRECCKCCENKPVLVQSPSRKKEIYRVLFYRHQLTL